MEDRVSDTLSVDDSSDDLGILHRFKKSIKEHKKLYFWINVVLKASTFVSFVIVWHGKLSNYLDRPEYEAVCEYVLSEDLDYQYDQNCTITVDNKNFTCDSEFGDKPSWNDTDRYSYEADDAKEFANDISTNYVKVLFYIWISFNCLFKLKHNHNIYKSKILKNVPKCSCWKKIKAIIFENLIEVCVGTAIYPITYPDYGDCFGCREEWACSHTFFTFSTVGFWVVLLFLLSAMFNFTTCVVSCIDGLCQNTCCACLLTIPMYCTIGFIVLAVSITQIDFLTSIYSSIQVSISTIYYFVLLFYGDVEEGAIQLIASRLLNSCILPGETYDDESGDYSYESEDSGYDSGDTSDTGYDSGYTSDTGNTGDNTGTADQGTSLEGDSGTPPSRTIRRALSSSRYLQYSDSDSDSESDSYLYSDEAESAKDFANDIKKGYLVLLYLVWILFNIGFRIRSNLYTYRSRILQTIPCYTKTKKLKIALYENLIDICVILGLSLYLSRLRRPF